MLHPVDLQPLENDVIPLVLDAKTIDWQAIKDYKRQVTSKTSLFELHKTSPLDYAIYKLLTQLEDEHKEQSPPDYHLSRD